ncbi:TrmB family transcriptional regulator [Paenibacillus melissococcoides]|uniref:TrmB family transcriptional regulator n=1 Tax=Paenibacillus melissococcoides TaxID=2912268 RepID=A0ABN8U7D0_9BACL|nr:TrmB family transcriptional regulator [Paenibacillus melissococcoides]CAH8245882.1 TrmB family transcriptional regulator [Paenibacillus melissococcoides]CAH8712354.1 TrmB family transcriptional regulator [Paenibacillus melissococcoides]CAH8713101.1 TrmB family transcriptional regulator [Paenibacillus melissococcoides]
MLQKFGFSQYESKVYEALVSSGEPMDATTVVKYSGVPKAKIYEVLARLIDKGVASDTISGKKKLYAALPLEAVIDKLAQEFENSIAQLRRSSERRAHVDDQVWTIKSDTSIQAYGKHLIEGAERSILISMWKDDFAAYVPLLERKEREGVRVEAMVTGYHVPQARLSKLHTLTPTDEHQRLERFAIIVVDGERLMFGGLDHGNWQAMHTGAQPFVTFFTEFFYHDVALAAISQKYYDELMQDEEMKALLMQLRY